LANDVKDIMALFLTSLMHFNGILHYLLEMIYLCTSFFYSREKNRTGLSSFSDLLFWCTNKM